MNNSPRNNPLHRSMCPCCQDNGGFRADATSRRSFLAAGAALAAAGAAAPVLSTPVQAQGGTDPELARLQGAAPHPAQGRRGAHPRPAGRRLRAGRRADRGRQDPRGPAEHRGVGDDAAVVDATNRIVIPGFVDTHRHSYQGILRNILPTACSIPDYNRDIQNTLTPAYSPRTPMPACW